MKAAHGKHPRAGIGNPPALPPLPHAYPLLLVDRVLMLEPDHWVVALKNVTRNDPLVDACGVLPPVLVAEVMAQAAGLAVAPSRRGTTTVMLVAIDRFRSRLPVVAGDQLVVTVRVVKQFAGSVKARAIVQVAGRRRAAGEVILHFPRLDSQQR